jgi:hypothetical protein
VHVRGHHAKRGTGPTHHRPGVVDRTAEHPVIISEGVAEQPRSFV